jgi:UDP-N-acetylmuramoyl-tripeptide--D-alanyl-D-alanine ligase
MKKIFRAWCIAILQWQAKQVLKKYQPKIIAITGSVGKTSTKDAIYSVLAESLHVRKSEKSFNNDIGIPLTILGLPTGWRNIGIWIENVMKGFSLLLFRENYPDWLVLEVGARTPGGIPNTVTWLKPDIVVITKIGTVPVHIEFFPTLEDLVLEKKALSDALKPDGILLVNADDPTTSAIMPTGNQKRYTYGISESADMRIGSPDILYAGDDNQIPVGIQATYHIDNKEHMLSIYNTVGAHALDNALAACAVGSLLHIPAEKCVQVFLKHDAPPGRMKLMDGIKDTMLVDDTYNASPIAMVSALETLHMIRNKGRKCVVLGDMLELGMQSHTAHENIGKLVYDLGFDFLVTVGVRAKTIGESACGQGFSIERWQHCDTAEQAGDSIDDWIESGDVILLKASQGIRLERAVERLMKNPQDAEKLLARQDSAWKENR